jgi:hypothetical protein
MTGMMWSAVRSQVLPHCSQRGLAAGVSYARRRRRRSQARQRVPPVVRRPQSRQRFGIVLISIVEDLAADVQLVVEPDDGGGGAFAADVDADPDTLSGLDPGRADTLLPGAGGEPVSLAFGPLAQWKRR